MNRRDRRRRHPPAARGGGGVPGPLDRVRALLAQERYADAEQHCRRLLAADRTSTDAHVLLAHALREQGRLDEAVLAARRATTQGPRSAAAHTELGAILAAQDRLIEAVKAFERALELDPGNADAHNRYGSVMIDFGQLEQALSSFGRVARLLPDHPVSHANIALVLARMGRHEDALPAYDRALALRPDDARLRYNRSFSRLGTGDLPGGWEDHESGFPSGERRPDRRLPVLRWKGGDLADRTIVLWREQGLGDEVRFASCYGEVVQRAGRVIIECTQRLVPLLQRSFPRAVVRAESHDPRTGAETQDFSGVDVHLPAGSLPRFLRRSIEDFPRHDGYLVADPRRRSHWRDRLTAVGGTTKVGIAWRSMNLETARLQHYLTLEELEPVLRTPGVEFVNLQYGPAEQLEAELREVEERTGVIVHRWDDIDYTNDLDAVAALTAELDVVIGPGSFPTVLAGALGVPTLFLTAPTPWTLGRYDQDPWFPDMQHFVRVWNESWQRAAEDAAEHLRQLITGALAG